MRQALACVGLLVAAAGAAGQDMPLSQILLPGEAWRELPRVADPVAIAGDRADNLYVADREGKIHRQTPDGNWSVFATAAGPVRCLAAGKGDTLLATVGARRGVVRFDEKGAATTLVEDVEAGDVAESPAGRVYYTVPARKAVFLAGRKEPVADGLRDPAGLALWADGGTLVVGEAAGRHLWAYRVLEDGSLDAGERYYRLRVRPKQVSQVRALTVDTGGRLYAATAEGVQIFDPTGRLSGVLSRPLRQPTTGVAFAGPGRDNLHVLCGGRLFVRRVRSQGLGPAAARK